MFNVIHNSLRFFRAPTLPNLRRVEYTFLAGSLFSFRNGHQFAWCLVAKQLGLIMDEEGPSRDGLSQESRCSGDRPFSTRYRPLNNFRDILRTRWPEMRRENILRSQFRSRTFRP